MLGLARAHLHQSAPPGKRIDARRAKCADKEDRLAAELRERNLETLPFDEALLDVLSTARLVKEFQLVNGRQPDLIRRALAGEHVGTIVHA